ncbi:MAG: ABC transporter permease, partial [Prevotellaceae bacterium]|nr:ABC transporter permease [Prevotellaceae bacterium]
PWAANQEVKDIRLGLVDYDHSTLSERLGRKVTASGYFKLAAVSGSYDEAMEGVASGDVDIILEIPQGFEKQLVDEGGASVMISANAVNGTKGSLGSSYLSSIVSDYAAGLREEQGIVATVSATMSMPSFNIMPQYRFNPHLDYKVFMVPALMVILLTMLTGFLPALNIVSEKEVGTIEQINVTPTKRLLFVLAKLIPYWVIGFAVLSLCMLLAAFLYGIVPVGSLPAIYLFASIYILVVSGMGLVISNHSETMQQAMFVMFFFIMVLLFMSGLFTPVASMPGWAQAITVVNPLKYFMQVMRLIYLKGSAFTELIPQFLALCAFALALNVWAVLSYRKSS